MPKPDEGRPMDANDARVRELMRRADVAEVIRRMTGIATCKAAHSKEADA